MRLLRTLVSALMAAGVLAGCGAAGLGSPPHSDERQRRAREIDVIEVAGLLDSVMVDFIEGAITDAAAGRALVLVMQLDSHASVVGRGEQERLVSRMSSSAVPIAVWVGPSGADAGPGSSLIWTSAHVRGRASRTTIDAVDPSGSGDPTIDAPTLGDFIVGLDGRRVEGRVLDTARVVAGKTTPRREPIVAARFVKPSLLARTLHATVSPAIATFLLLGGLLLVLFEFFSLGVGVAGLSGATALVLAGYGLGELPVRAWAVVVVVAGFVAFGIDLQAGQTSALWRSVGVVGVGIGAGMLVDPGVGAAYLPAGLAVLGVVVALLAGFPAMLHSRFATSILAPGSNKPAGQA